MCVGDGNEPGFHRIDGYTLVGTQVLSKNHVFCDCRKEGGGGEGKRAKRRGEREGGEREERREREKRSEWREGRKEEEKEKRRGGEKKIKGFVISNVSYNQPIQHSLLDLC